MKFHQLLIFALLMASTVTSDLISDVNEAKLYWNDLKADVEPLERHACAQDVLLELEVARVVFLVCEPSDPAIYYRAACGSLVQSVSDLMLSTKGNLAARCKA